MVIFGTRRVLAAMTSKSRTLIGLRHRHRDWLRRTPAGRVGILADRVDVDVTELTVEVAVIGAAAEFAVGCELKTDAILKREHLSFPKI
jgi:hypothetical protein